MDLDYNLLACVTYMSSYMLQLGNDIGVHALFCLIIHTRSLGIEPRVLTTVDTNASIVLHYLMSIDNLCVIIFMTNTNVVRRIRS